MAIKHANGTGLGPESVALHLHGTSARRPRAVAKRAVGGDMGNTNTKVDMRDERNVTLAAYLGSSALAAGDPKRIAALERGLGSEQVSTVNWIKRTDPVSGSVRLRLGGASALTQSRFASTRRGDPSRYWSADALDRLLLSVALARPQETELEMYVATGVPIRVALATPDYREQIKKALEGEFTYEVNGREYHTVVHVPFVVMEGAVALVHYRTPHDNAFRAVIDIGGQTTDVVVSQGLFPVSERSGGLDIGIEAIADYVEQQIQAQYGRDLRPDERYDLLYAFSQATAGKRAPEWPAISAGGQTVATTQLLVWCREGAEYVSAEIRSYLGKLWGQNMGRDLSLVHLIGGNPRAFAPYLEGSLPTLDSAFDHAPLANASGYADLAVKALQKALQ